MKITSKLSLAFLILSLFPLITTFLVITIYEERHNKKGMLSHLESVASILDGRIESIIDQNFERLLLISSRTQLRFDLKSFIETKEKKYQIKMNRSLHDALSSIKSCRSISVLTLDGKIVASTDSSRIGRVHTNDQFFGKGQKENFIDLFIDENRTILLRLSDPLSLNNGILGVIVIEISSEDFKSVTAFCGLEKTGEIVLAKQNEFGDALFLLPVRSDSQAVLMRTISKNNQKVPAVLTLLKKRDRLTEGIDYRGKKVLAATRYIERTGWELVVKIDEDEVLEPMKFTRILLLTIISISSLLIILISLNVARSITKPIINLTNEAKKIVEDNLRSKIEITSIDEIGILAQSFNQMTHQLIEANTDLDKKVHERTEELQCINDLLLQEVEEREQIQKEIQEREKRYRTLVESIPDGIYILDHEWKYVLVNENSTNIVKIPKEKLLGNKITDLFPGIEQTSFFKKYSQVMITREPDGIIDTFTFQDSRSGWYEVRIYPIPEGILCIARDITEHKKIEKELVESQKQIEQAQRLASTGRLAASIAHEINNPLQAIVAHIGSMERRLPENSKDKNSIEQIKIGITRIKNTVKQLLDLNRSRVSAIERIDVNEVIESTVKLMENQLSINNVTVEKHLNKPIPLVSCLTQELSQVFLNLILNAQDAMKNGGIVTIRSNVQDNKLQVDFQDNGSGIPESIIDHIFEPFFTTKSEMLGTGLGLSTSKSIIESFGGKITVKSKVGKGTTFTMVFPIQQ